MSADIRRSVFVSLVAGFAMIVSLAWVQPADAQPLNQSGFDDVGPDHLFATEIDWLASEGITRGCNPPDNTAFCPDDHVTRGQMAAFLARALTLPAADESFDDATGHLFEADVAALAGAGITRGCNPPGNTRFCPDDRVTRGQMAAFLVRALSLPAADESFDDTTGHLFEADVAALAEAGITRGCNPPTNTRFCPDDPVTRGQMAAFLFRALSNAGPGDTDPGDTDPGDTDPDEDLPPAPEIITAGLHHTCRVVDDTAYCWGANYDGQLGIGGSGRVNQPVKVAGELVGKTVTAISAAEYYTCAVADGDAYCWGANNEGQLGDGSTDDARLPVKVAGELVGKTVTAISAGNAHACAIADGDAYCWGANLDGQLGDGSTASSPVPVAVAGPLADKAVSVISAGNAHTCAIADGDAYCWGRGDSGQLGDGSAASSPVPVAVAGPLVGRTVTAISAGGNYVCAVAGGGAYCWGSGDDGGLGNGSDDDAELPVVVAGDLFGKTVTAISAGDEHHSCAIAGGDAYCWGNGPSGQLGNGGTDSSSVPVAVVGMADMTVTFISAKGDDHTCAVADGDAYCWGANYDGQLGIGSWTDIRNGIPMPVVPVP